PPRCGRSCSPFSSRITRARFGAGRPRKSKATRTNADNCASARVSPRGPTRCSVETNMTGNERQIDVMSCEVIAAQLHSEVDGQRHASLPEDLAAAASKYFSTDAARPDLDSIAEYYRERRMAAVVFTVDAETHLGHQPLSSADIAEGADRNSDVLIP